MDMEVLSVMLALAINAPSKKKAKKCCKMAAGLATRLSFDQVEYCKEKAIIRADENNYEIEQFAAHVKCHH
jgi:hypothetical protein